MKVKRYDPTPYNQSRVVERPNGEYVKYTDYAKLEELVLAFQGACSLKGHDYLKVKEPCTYRCTNCGHMDFEGPE